MEKQEHIRLEAMKIAAEITGADKAVTLARQIAAFISGDENAATGDNRPTGMTAEQAEKVYDGVERVRQKDREINDQIKRDEEREAKIKRDEERWNGKRHDVGAIFDRMFNPAVGKSYALETLKKALEDGGFTAYVMEPFTSRPWMKPSERYAADMKKRYGPVWNGEEALKCPCKECREYARLVAEEAAQDAGLRFTP